MTLDAVNKFHILAYIDVDRIDAVVFRVRELVKPYNRLDIPRTLALRTRLDRVLELNTVFA